MAKLPSKKTRVRQEEFRFGLGKCSLGHVLVASSEQGVVAILTGKNAARLVEDLQLRFPKNRVMRAGRDYTDLVTQVTDFIDAPSQGLYIPLDMRGTGFQQRVWKAVRKIPLGETSNYSEIAREIGAPRSMRAVGSTCTKNNLFFVVPCHRVLHKNGAPSGDWQRSLLNREKTFLKKKK